MRVLLALATTSSGADGAFEARTWQITLPGCSSTLVLSPSVIHGNNWQMASGGFAVAFRDFSIKQWIILSQNPPATAGYGQSAHATQTSVTPSVIPYLSGSNGMIQFALQFSCFGIWTACHSHKRIQNSEKIASTYCKWRLLAIAMLAFAAGCMALGTGFNRLKMMGMLS
jgi:hypothetical protein